MRTRSPHGRQLAAASLLALAATGCGLGSSTDADAQAESAPVQDATTTDVEESEPDDVIDDTPQELQPPDDAVGLEDETTSDVLDLADDQADDQVDDPTPDADGDGSPAEPLAEAQGGPDFPELQILDLRRDGDTVTVEFSIVVGDEDHPVVGTSDAFSAGPDRHHASSSGGEAGALDARRHAVSGVTLIDRTNAKRHLVLRDSTGECLCTRFGSGTGGGDRYMHSAQFPAPPDDVTEMTVEVPQFPSIDNVPLRDVS